MKKITSSIFLMIAALGFSQNNPINFEAGGNGAAWTWNTFENPEKKARNTLPRASLPKGKKNFYTVG